MMPLRKRSAVIVIFTALIILLVNLSWWLFYARTEQSFENQLSHRLAAIAIIGASLLKSPLADSLAAGYLGAYDSTLEIIENIRLADSLSEVFIIDADYRYLATTLPEPDSVYYLAALNYPYIDSIFSLNWLSEIAVMDNRPLVTRGYRAGDVLLKSAFVPLYDTVGAVLAVLGVEADVDYADVLFGLRNNLYLSSAISVGAGVIFGLFFFLIQRKINAAEQSLFLSKSQANLGRMVAVVSHEIKNPLMIIRASAERLQKGGMKEANFIIEETDRLNGIVTGYLDFASGKKKVKREPVDLKILLPRIVEQFAPRLASEGISLSLKPIEDTAVAEGDPVALRQVLINFILNGADAVRGKQNGRVEVECRTDSGHIVIEVADNGPGIRQRDLKSIFDSFYTTKTTGSGLGLYHSRRLVREMAGKIGVKSTPGGPTRFMVVLHPADKG
jgi:signal transduction histidine kinase